MQTHVFEHRGYEIVVQPEQNAYNAWQVKVSVPHVDSNVAEFRPETVQPEWLTQEEAVRDGIEWDARFVDHALKRVARPDVIERSAETGQNPAVSRKTPPCDGFTMHGYG